MHIKDEIDQLLTQHGWKRRQIDPARYGEPLEDAWRWPSIEYLKEITGFAEAGTVSDGTRVVSLAINETGRYFSRLDGFGNIESDLDLRDFWGRPSETEYWSNPRGAIVALASEKAFN